MPADERNDMPATLTRIHTPKCCHCGLPGRIEVPLAGALLWEAGMLTQHAFPELSADQREQIINGTHPKCWDAIFGTEDED